ncbi:hypothetical protein O181_080271 [Austropuccinia psidii MF-1]|uniref:Uncharacterized protein n=1 Tax=Austropuccinia psidii MF-1 TaxID=1389203 RepID=A0A9Q3FHW5_9BASI|nr:hypothetical protein [Austropuccinia psidii MF-1]
MPQEDSVEVYKVSQKAYKTFLQHRVPDPCRSVEKLHELLSDCEKVLGPSQHLKATHWIASIVEVIKHDAFDRRMEGEQPSTTVRCGYETLIEYQVLFQSSKFVEAKII